MTEHQHIAYFGYGSLVNRDTHRTDIVEASPAILNGWKRCWRPRRDTSVFNVAILSVREQSGTSTEGLLVIDRAENLPAIDERERAYDRVRLHPDQLQHNAKLPANCPIYVYEVPVEPELTFGTQRILRSYLEAVLQGYLLEHGFEAMSRFVCETEAFHIGILDDRANPLYQRSVELSHEQRDLIDAVLDHLPSEIA